PGDGIDLHQMGFDVDTGDAGGLHVRADGIGELAVAGVAQRDVEDHRDDEEDHDGPDAGADEVELLGEAGDRLALGVPLGNAAGGHHHAERGDEGRDLGLGDELAVDDAGQQADADADGNRHDDRKVG